MIIRKLLMIAGVAALAIPSLAAAATGYYDGQGRWMATAPTGYYDDQGRWIPTTPAGYYDVNGNWIATAPSAVTFGADTAFVGGGSLDMRENALEHRIQAGRANGALSHDDAAGLYRDLADIRRDQAHNIADHDGLTSDDRDNLGRRLDDIGSRIHDDWRGE